MPGSRSDRFGRACLICGEPIRYRQSLRAERVTCGAQACQRQRKLHIGLRYYRDHSGQTSAQYQQRKRDGICVRCGRQPADAAAGTARCAGCKQYMRMRNHLARGRAKAAGKCTVCLRAPLAAGMVSMCAACADRNRLRQSDVRAARREDPEALAAHRKQAAGYRSRARRKMRAEGRCRDCGAATGGPLRCRDCRRAARAAWKANRRARRGSPSA